MNLFITKEVLVKHEKARGYWQSLYNLCIPIFWKIRAFGHFRPTSGGRKCRKTHFHTKTLHLNLFPGCYDHPLQRYILEKNRWRQTTRHPKSMAPNLWRLKYICQKGWGDPLDRHPKSIGPNLWGLKNTHARGKGWPIGFVALGYNNEINSNHKMFIRVYKLT